MKNFKYPLLFIVLISILYCSCSKTDNAIPATQTSSNTSNVVVKNITTATNGFNYKTFYQEVATTNNRKGIVILAHGDGGSSNDVLINDQCTALAQEGFVAITTSYRAPTFTGGSVDNGRFKADMESIVNAVTNLYAIPVNKTIVGGLSRGGNLAFNMFLPSGLYGSPTTLNLKGAILECSGGDNYKGSAMLKQVAYMSNKIDVTVGADALAFQTGLTTNTNNAVKTLSECYIVNSDGHCTNADEYKTFLVRKVKEWLP
jgi:dienelactone hydrolase